MRFVHSALPVLLLLSLPAQAGPLIVADGETLLVLAGEQLTTGDVLMNGTFRNQGEVTNTGLFENFGFTDNQGLFRNFGEFRNLGSMNNDGTFLNEGSVVIGADTFFFSLGTFISTGQLENYSTAVVEFAELDISGVVENYGTLTTRDDGGIHNLTGSLDNTGNWYNGGRLELGSHAVSGALFDNTGLFINYGSMEVLGDAQFLNSGRYENTDELLVTSQFINDGELYNDGTLTIDDAASPGVAGISGAGSVFNDGTMTVTQSGLTIQGDWTNDGTMNLWTDVLRIEGTLLTTNSFTSISGDVEVVAGGRLAHRSLWTDIDGWLVNRGTTHVESSSLSATEVENYGTVVVDGQMIAERFVQHDGVTAIRFELVTPSVEIYGGLLTATGDFSGQITNNGPETLVQVIGGTISGGTSRLSIFGGLVLYDDATMEINIRRDDNDRERAGDIAATGDIALAGTLVVNLEPGTAVAAGDIWTLASGLSIGGMFDNMLLPSVAGIVFDVFIWDVGPPGVGFQQLQLQALQAVPVPGALILFVGALGVLLKFRRCG